MNTKNFKNPIRVLLVDDHKSFLDGLTMLINTDQSVMQVAGVAGSRDEALAAAAREKPDIILLDIDLGNDSGLDILPQLAAEKNAKIIILTGILDRDVHERAILLGAKGVLAKTEAAQVILKAITKVHEGEIWIGSDTLNSVLSHLTNKKSANRISKDPDERKIEGLTGREREIIRALVNNDSSTNKEIAESLFISSSTLKNHLTIIYSKLNVRNRVELFKYALTHGLDAANDRSSSE